MNSLTRLEQCLLLDALGPGWTLASVLLGDAGIDHLKASILGGTFVARFSPVDEALEHFQVSARGVEIGRFGSDPAHVITWSSIRAHRASVPVTVLDALRVADAKASHHNQNYPTFDASTDRAKFAEAHRAFHRDVVAPWSAEMTRLTTARRKAVLAAFPAVTGDDEPTDLLGYLAQLEAVSA